METLQVVLVVTYLLGSSYFFIKWLKFFKGQPELAPEDTFLSLVILVITTILWPLIVPISFLEFLRTRKLEFSSIMPVVLVILVSLLAVSGLTAFGASLPQPFSHLLRANHF